MSGNERISVDPDALLVLESQLRGLPLDFDTAIMTDFSTCDGVAAAYEKLMNKWDESRQHINDSVLQLAKVVGAVREAFVDTDRQLSVALDQPTKK